jgi:hypothetical protein
LKPILKMLESPAIPRPRHDAGGLGFELLERRPLLAFRARLPTNS